MGAIAIKPPPGFVLDEPDISKPPEGFVLDQVDFDQLPDELVDQKDRIRNSDYYSRQFGIEPETAYDLEPQLNQQVFGSEKLSANPAKLFYEAFKQSLADKPAMMLKGAEVYTPGRALGMDTLLDKSSIFLRSLQDPDVKEQLQQVASGKLWPTGDDKRWWQVEAQYLPEVINSWAVNVADQIPIMLATIAGRTAGKAIGKPIGGAAAAGVALVTAGPDPSDVVTAAPVAAITSEVVKHLGGAAPMVAMEAGNFMDEADNLRLDRDIAEKYAKGYGLGSGAIEYAQWLWVLGRYSKIGKPMQKSILKEVLGHIGGSMFEGVEEVSQQGLQNFLLQKAVVEMKERHSDYKGEAPKITEGLKRSGQIGAGVAFITGMPGTGMTIANGALARQQQIKPETKKFLGEPSVAEVEKVAEAPAVPPKVPEAPITPEEPIVAPEPTEAPIEVPVEVREEGLAPEQKARIDKVADSIIAGIEREQFGEAVQSAFDVLEDEGVTPQQAHKQFWAKTFPQLSAENQKKAREELSKAVGEKVTPENQQKFIDFMARELTDTTFHELEPSDRPLLFIEAGLNEEIARIEKEPKLPEAAPERPGEITSPSVNRVITASKDLIESKAGNERGYVLNSQTGEIIAEIESGIKGGLNIEGLTDEFVVNFRQPDVSAQVREYKAKHPGISNNIAEYHYHPVTGGPTKQDIQQWFFRASKGYENEYGVIDNQYVYTVRFPAKTTPEFKTLFSSSQTHFQMNNFLEEKYDDFQAKPGEFFAERMHFALTETAKHFGFTYLRTPSFKPPTEAAPEVITGKPYQVRAFRGVSEKTPVDEGMYGKGTYYTTSEEYAAGFGEVGAYDIKLKNPYVASTNEVEELGRSAREQAIAEGKSIVEQNEIASQTIRDILEKRGHDGIVMPYATGQEIIVFKAAPKVAEKKSWEKIKESTRVALEQRGVSGDELLNAMDLGDELTEKGGQISAKGMVTLYHRTTSENAQRIVETGQMQGKEDRLFFGTSPTGQIEGYGEAVVKVQLPIESLELNDVFTDETHVTRKLGKIGKAFPVQAEIWTAKQAKEPTTLREDVTGILGGLPLEKPGLTKAEIEHLGVRGRAVLRTAQERGLKVGYKKGVADTIVNARRSMGAFVTKKKLELKNRIDALNIVKTYVPKDEQGRYMRRVVQVKTEKNITKLYTQIMDFLQKADQRQAVRDFKGFIKKVKKDYKAGQRTFGKLRVSVRDEFVKVLDEFDLAKVSEDKQKELESRLKFIQRIAGVAEKVFIEFNEDLETGLEKNATDFLVMGQRRIDETNRLSKTPIKELTAQDIRQMQGILQYLLEINNLKKDSKARRHAENLGKDIIDSRNELPTAKPEISEYTGLLGAMRWATVEGHATISTLANLITGKTNTITRKVLVDNPNQANIERKVLYKSFMGHFRNLADKAGISWNDIKQLNETTQITIGGKTFDATYDDVLSIYAHTMADDNLIRILTTEGLNVYTYKPVVKGVFKKKVINEVGAPTLGELRDIAALVPSVHKKLLDIHFKTNKDVQAPAINKMSMQTENYEKAVYDKYWHVSRQFETVPEGKKTDLSVAAESWGRYRSRTGGSQRINIRPFSQEVILGMQMDAAYATMTQSMEDARTLLANRHWRRKVKDSGGRRALNELVTMFRRSQGLISDQTILDMTAANILNSAGKSILSIRPSGMGVQIASVPAAFKFVDKKYFMQAETPSKTEIKALMESSPVLWLRWKGKQFDYALGAVGSHKAFQGMLFDHVDVTDKALIFYTWGDQIAIWKIWKAAGRQITAEQTLKEGTTEYEEATLKLLYDALETQPQWDMMHRSPITSSPSVWLRGMTMFMSARNAQYQVLLQAVDDLKKGRITQKEAAERIGSIGMAAAFVSISKRIARLAVKGAAITTLAAIGFIDSPEEKAKEEALKEVKKVPIETVFNLMGLNALGSLFVSIGYAALRRIKYGEMHYSDMRSGNMLADIMLDIVNAGELYALTAYQAVTEEKYQSGSRAGEYKALYTALAAADQTAQLIAYRFGWPYEGPKADIIWPVKAAARKTTKFKNIEAIP